MAIRTDLAMEAHEMCRSEARDSAEIDGVSAAAEDYGGVSITRVNITNENGSRRLGKAMGRYVTIEAPNLKYSKDEFDTVCGLICDELHAMADVEPDSLTLVVGLGNGKITPDALGTRVIDYLMVTHHIKRYMKDILSDNISNVCAIVPGVLGTTGIETVDIIKSITEKIKPQLVIVIDALAAADIRRVSTTVQIADTGIQPGAGVGNNRECINEDVLGVKVIAIGVPTVIDAASISNAEIPKDLAPLMVTTQDIDTVIDRMSHAVATGINLALHKDITPDEIENYVG